MNRPLPPGIRVVVGLGNPGAAFDGSPHNIGRYFVQRLATALGVSWRKEKQFSAQIAENDKLILCLPETYMNRSGKAVRAVLQQMAISPQEVLVAYDCLNYGLGKWMIKQGGSALGHNGLRSILSETPNEFWRLRFGVGPTPVDVDTIDYVADKLPEEQWLLLENSVDNVLKDVFHL